MTDQIQSGMMAMMQVMAAQSQVPQVGGKKAQGAEDDFQKMLEQKSQPEKAETPKEQPKNQKPEETEQPEQPAAQQPQEEDGHAMVKRLVETGLMPADAANAYLMQLQTPVQQAESAPVVLQTAALEEDNLVSPEFQQAPGQQIDMQQRAEVLPEAEIQPEQLFQPTEAQPQETLEIQQTPVSETPVQAEIAPEAESLPVESVQVQQGGEEEEGLENPDLPQSAEPVFRDVKATPIKVGARKRISTSRSPAR